MDMRMDRQQESGHACRQVDRQAGGRQAGRQAGTEAGWRVYRLAGRHAAVKNCAVGRWKYYFDERHKCRFRIRQNRHLDVLTNKIHDMRTFSAPIYSNCELSLINVAKFKRLLLHVHDMYNVNFNFSISQN
jgi:hypothetical protein